MPTYAEGKRRRIEQFAQYLRLMGLRHRKVEHDGCFIIFEDSPPEDTDSSQLKESVAIKVDCSAGETGLAARISTSLSPVTPYGPRAYHVKNNSDRSEVPRVAKHAHHR